MPWLCEWKTQTISSTPDGLVHLDTTFHVSEDPPSRSWNPPLVAPTPSSSITCTGLEMGRLLAFAPVMVALRVRSLEMVSRSAISHAASARVARSDLSSVPG